MAFRDGDLQKLICSWVHLYKIWNILGVGAWRLKKRSALKSGYYWAKLDVLEIWCVLFCCRKHLPDVLYFLVCECVCCGVFFGSLWVGFFFSWLFCFGVWVFGFLNTSRIRIDFIMLLCHSWKLPKAFFIFAERLITGYFYIKSLYRFQLYRGLHRLVQGNTKSVQCL